MLMLYVSITLGVSPLVIIRPHSKVIASSCPKPSFDGQLDSENIVHTVVFILHDA